MKFILLLLTMAEAIRPKSKYLISSSNLEKQQPKLDQVEFLIDQNDIALSVKDIETFVKEAIAEHPNSV